MTYANTALCAMLGYTDEELVGKSTTSILYGFSSDFVFEKIKERISGKTGRYESTLLHKSGRMIPTMISASPLRGHDGEYVGSFAVFADITNQKSAEKGMQNARNRALLYRDIMGHDIRNQLQQIQVETELLLSSMVDEKARKRLESILQAVSQSASIISETRSIEQLAEMPLCERLLDNVLHECVMAAIVLLDHVEFRLSIQVSEARVMADSYLELLISDLLEETCKHSLGNQINVSLTQAESDYLLCISSNGPKMPVDIKDNLMGTNQRSVGLCFHLVRQIIQKYGASVKIRDISNEDSSEGSMMILTFPRL
ncbi:MAG: PAS domain S-box protein [Candidatus Odinarchaeota archaeon]